MTNTQRKLLNTPMSLVSAIHAPVGSPRRHEAEQFIRSVFLNRYSAHISHFAPDLMLLEQRGTVIAAAGWRCAQHSPLFLEHYLDLPIEQSISQLAGHAIGRQRIVEVGHLASQKPGSSVRIINTLANHLSQQGFEWVVFTATQELIGIFSKLGLPLLALAAANPAKLHHEAQAWGSYYDTQPVVVAGRIRFALEHLELAA